LIKEGYQLCGFQGLSDHCRYTVADLAAITANARSMGADALATTEKDYIKIKELSLDLPLVVLRVGLVVDEGFSLLLDALLSKSS
jgi:tetraacyldisaccharide 4'-kinase